jgi:drug/metabolite transporter (DMT)-like permease
VYREQERPRRSDHAVRVKLNRVTSSQPSTASQPSRAQVFTILTVGILAVSMSAIFIRFARESSGSTNVAFGLLIAAGRIALASLVTAPFGFAALRREWPNQEARGFNKAVWLAIAAGVGLAAHFAFWISSLSFTSVASSTAIVTTNPIWLSLFAWIVWKQVPSRAVMIGIAVSFVGGLLVALGDSAGSASGAFLNPMLGNALALLGAFAVSAYYLLGRAAQQEGLSLPAYTGVAYTTAALVLAPLPLLFGVPYTGYPVSTYLWIALLGLVPQVIGHTSFNWAVKYMNPAIVTMVILLEPIGSSLAAVILFREIPGPLTILGASLLLLGVFIAVRPAPNSRPKPV